jgi:hypothetical protein
VRGECEHDQVGVEPVDAVVQVGLVPGKREVVRVRVRIRADLMWMQWCRLGSYLVREKWLG